ncbi:MAG: DUF4411 family protein [Candidatus Zixiibacteriota bacterium]
MSRGNSTIYSLDSSSLIVAWTDAYPIAAFESFWKKLDELIAAERVVVSEEVFCELEKQDDDLFKWVKVRPKMVVPHTEEIQDAVIELLKSHPLLIKATGTNRSGADPFVIALARCRKAVVISQERTGSNGKPKIPDVCSHYKVPCERLKYLIANEGWKF